MYSTCTVKVIVTYADTLTDRGWRESDSTCTVTVTEFVRGRGMERVTKCVQYVYCQSYCNLCEYSDRGLGRVTLCVQYAY